MKCVFDLKVWILNRAIYFWNYLGHICTYQLRFAAPRPPSKLIRGTIRPTEATRLQDIPCKRDN